MPKFEKESTKAELNRTKPIKTEIERILNEMPGPLSLPQIRTRFLKRRITEERLDSLNWNKVEEAINSLRLGAPRYKNSDFRYIAELMHLEGMLYTEHYPRVGWGFGIYWGLGMQYLTKKYPKERLEMLDELCSNPKHNHRKEWAEHSLEEKKEQKREQETKKLSKYIFEGWWLENGGI